jgi:hypothetical protein
MTEDLNEFEALIFDDIFRLESIFADETRESNAKEMFDGVVEDGVEIRHSSGDSEVVHALPGPSVTTEGEQAVTLPRPCAECRKSRVRCDRKSTCSRCQRLGLQCKLPPTVRRGRPPLVPGEHGRYPNLIFHRRRYSAKEELNLTRVSNALFAAHHNLHSKCSKY